MQNNEARARDIERRLRRVDSPEPPADLLDRIRDDIPDYLRPIGEAGPRAPKGSRRYRLVAASVLLAVAGGFLAYRVLQEAPDPTSSVATRVVLDSDVIERAGAEGDTGRTAAPPSYPAPAQAQSPDSTGAEAKRDTEKRSNEYQTAPPEEPAPIVPVTAEVGPREAAGAGRGSELREESADPRLHRAKKVPTSEDLEQLRAVGYIGEPEPSVPSAPTGSESIAYEEVVRMDEAQAADFLERRRRQALREQLKSLPGGPAPVVPSPGPSTGGSAEPNDQPYGDMFFRPYGTNPFVDTEDDPQSTFGLDVDTGAYTLARSYLERGHLPPVAAIRVEEFVNFFDYRDPAPRRGEFTLAAEGAPSPWNRGPRYQLLRVGVRGREVSAAHRKDATLIFVVDVSGSMARENRIQLVKRALRLLLDQLGPGDRVGLVVYGSYGRVLLEPSGDLEAVRRAIDRLSTGGSTNAEEGLLLGYEMARRNYRPESITRLVLCSDGVANVGRTGPESILARVGREAEEGIELTTVGFGMGNYNDVLMEQLADQGDGNYAYVDTLEEARRVFVQNLTGTLQTIAADAKIQVEFDPRVITRYRLLGYENRDVADHRFRDDTVDAGEIGAGHRVAALYEVKLADDAPWRRPLAEVRLRYRSKATGQVVEDSLQVRPDQLARRWRAASPSLRLAALAAELAEVLKRSYWARDIRPHEFRQRAREVERDFPGDRDVAELVRLTERAAALIDWSEPPRD